MSETTEQATRGGTRGDATPAPSGEAFAQAAGQGWLARITVTLKPVVLDPQGDAVLHGLQQLGYSAVSSVRVGKYLEVALAAANQHEAEAAVRQMCDRLLANPVIERYAYSVEPRVTQESAAHDEQ